MGTAAIIMVVDGYRSRHASSPGWWNARLLARVRGSIFSVLPRACLLGPSPNQPGDGRVASSPCAPRCKEARRASRDTCANKRSDPTCQLSERWLLQLGAHDSARHKLPTRRFVQLCPVSGISLPDGWMDAVFIAGSRPSPFGVFLTLMAYKVRMSEDFT